MQPSSISARTIAGSAVSLRSARHGGASCRPRHAAQNGRSPACSSTHTPYRATLSWHGCPPGHASCFATTSAPSSPAWNTRSAGVCPRAQNRMFGQNSRLAHRSRSRPRERGLDRDRPNVPLSCIPPASSRCPGQSRATELRRRGSPESVGSEFTSEPRRGRQPRGDAALLSDPAVPYGRSCPADTLSSADTPSERTVALRPGSAAAAPAGGGRGGRVGEPLNDPVG